jgi:hypothetical protein
MVRVLAKTRHQHGSPSVTIEKGAYRLHAPLLSRPSSKLHGKEVASRTAANSLRSQYENRLALLLVALALAAGFCFGSAYYLFKTRWESPAIPPFRSISDLALASSFPSIVEATDFDPVWGDDPVQTGIYGDDKETKYLAYLPHSGFHNQRIAFENALVLARILNRTLLVPPVRLGKSVLHYGTFENLKEFVASSDKTGLRHCADVSSWSTLPVECGDFFDYTFVPWDWLVNLTTVRKQQQLISRWDMTDTWLEHKLRITNNDTFTIKDRHQYHYRFVDNDLFDIAGSRYDESASISLLVQVQQRLLQFGTLHGSSRLRLRVEQNIGIRTQIRKSMVFTNQYLLDIATCIGELLGGDYLAAHIRIGDDHFSRDSMDNVRLIWWKLVHKTLGMTMDEATHLESELTNAVGAATPKIPLDIAAIRVPHPSPAPIKVGVPTMQCKGTLHTSKDRTVLNTPLYISTDVPHPEGHPALDLFLKTFPCTFFLSDFKRPNSSSSLAAAIPVLLPQELTNTSLHSSFSSPLQHLSTLRNPYDGLMLKDFLHPFLDAVVAGRAWAVVGTPGSTFSQFVEDVLWREWKGWEIVQRG